MPRPDCYDYIRGHYHVPAYIGMRVRSEGREGVVVPARTNRHYLHVLFDGEKFLALLHPTDEVEYLVEGQ